MTPTPLQAAEWRLTAAAGTADERDRCTVRAPDVRCVLNELARLQELELEMTRQEEVVSTRIHPTTGCCVTFVDWHGVPHPALVLSVWGGAYDVCQPALNLCFVDLDPSRIDRHGADVLHVNSVVHTSMQAAPGNYWRWEDEE